MSHIKPFKTSQKQHGYVFFLSLVFLLAVTILGILLARGNTSQEVMARGYRDMGVAFQRAEIQAQDAELSIDPTALDGVTIAQINCETINTEEWASEQEETSLLIDRIDQCEGSTSLGMGRSTTQQVDQKYRIVVTDFEDPQRRDTQVVIETVFIP